MEEQWKKYVWDTEEYGKKKNHRYCCRRGRDDELNLITSSQMKF